MSVTSPTVPRIAITAEDTDDENDQYDGMDIGEVATDIEEMDFGGERKKRKQKTHKQAAKVMKKGDTTDDEEIEGTGDELDTCIIKHEHPISVEDVLDLEEPPTYEETFRTEGKGPKNKRKLKTQSSTSASSHLGLDGYEANQVPTDIEDFDDSGDEEEISEKDETCEFDLIATITQDLGLTDISDSVKKCLNGNPSPMATPSEGLSENEGEITNHTKQLMIPSKRNKLLSPVSLSSQLSDLTDTEILQSEDSNDDDNQDLKPKHTRTRHRKHKSIRGAVTDTEDLDISDDEARKLIGQISVSKLPNFHVKKQSLKYIGKLRSESEPAIIFNEIPDKGKIKKTNKKSKSNNLNVEMLEIEGLTDVEDIEAGESAAEEEPAINYDLELDPVLSEELDSYYGTTEETSSTTKKDERLYKTESFISQKTIDKCESYNDDSKVETDEENYENDTIGDDIDEIKIAEDSCSIRFVPYKKPKLLKIKNKKKSKTSVKSSNLLVINNDEENLLTDTEYLNSSDEENEGMNQIAAVILSNETNDDTGSESMDEFDGEYRNFDNVPDEYLPKVVREQITVKETPDDNIITVSAIPDDYLKLLSVIENQANYPTDVEDFSADEDLQPVSIEFDDDEMLPDINMVDEGTTESIDVMKSPIKEYESEGETDYEDIRSEIKIKKTKKKLYLTDFLEGKQNIEAKLTDVEDFDLSDAENLDRNLLVREIRERCNSSTGIRTDMEEMETSGDESDDRYPLTPEPSVSYKILQEISGNNTSAKEGNGPFSKQDRKKLYKKNRCPYITPASPMQTDTDEIFTSADDESHSYSRAETATPAQMRQDLDEATNLKVTTQNTRKLDLEAADEVMYIKGGGFISDQYTDVEDMGVSDEEYYNALDKKIEDKNQVCVSIGGENGNNVSISVEENDSVTWNNGKISSNSNREKEWSTVQEQPASLIDQINEPSQPTQDAVQQDTGLSSVGYNVSSYNGVRRKQAENTYANNPQPLTYTYLDNILDHMLAEVDKQEKLVTKETEFQPSCINTVHLNPSEQAFIELPNTSSAKSIEETHINTFAFDEQESKIIPQIEFEICTEKESNLNLFENRFINLTESASKTIDKYLKNIKQNENIDKNIKSEPTSQSTCVNTINLNPPENALVELPIPISKQSKKKSHVNTYDFGQIKKNEIIDLNSSDDNFETNNISIAKQCDELLSNLGYATSDYAINKDIEKINLSGTDQYDSPDIWWEGTFRDLSMVPEEDENNFNEINSKKCIYKTPFHSKTTDLTYVVTDDICDTYSQCSSSEERTTGDDYETSESDEQIVYIKPIKPEVRLMVKTTDNGKDEIELCSLKEVLQQYKSSEKLNENKENQKFKRNLSNTLPRSFTESSEYKGTILEKPTFTLQRLFVRSPGFEPSFIQQGNLLSSREISKSQPELVAASNIKYPLQLDTSQEIDLHANAPFYPCYDQINKQIERKLSETYTNTYDTDTFPSAYCDWLLPSDPENEGITTSSPKTILKSDKKLINEQTSSLIESESHSESKPGTPVKTLPDQESSKTSAQKEQEKDKKEKKGFFSSLKSLVGKDEKHSKKDSPKKGKKFDDVSASPKGSGKPKLPTPEAERKLMSTYDDAPTIILNTDSIPDIDEVINDRVIQVTDLDVDPAVTDDIKRKAATFVENVINDGQTAVSKILEQQSIEAEQRDQQRLVDSTAKDAHSVKFNLASSVKEETKDKHIPELSNEPINYSVKNNDILQNPMDNWKVLTNDMIQNEIQFQGWSDDYVPKLAFESDANKLQSKQIEESLKEELPKAKKTKGFFKIFGKKESKESDESDTQTDDPKSAVTTSDSDKETEKKGEEKRKKKRGKLFGIFHKKDKKDKDSNKIEEHEKAEIERSEKDDKHPEFSKEVQQQMVDSAHFLMFETEIYEDVRLVYPTPDLTGSTETKKEKSDEKTTDDKEKTKSKGKKHGGFFTKIGEKLSGSDTKETINEASDKSGDVINDLSQKFNETTSDTTTILDSTKDKSAGKVIQSAKAVQKVGQETIDKTDELLSDVSNDVKQAAKDTKDKTSVAFGDLGQKISDTTSDTKDNLVSAKDKSIEKAIETSIQVKEVVKDTKDETSGFFSDFGGKISDTASDTKDSIVSVKDRNAEKLKETSSIVKEVAKDSKDKTGEFLSDLGQEISETTIDTKDNFVSAKDKTVDKVKQSTSEVKESAKEIKDKTSDKLSDLGGKISDKTTDAKGSITSTKEKSAEKMKATASDVKEVAKDTKEKTSGFFSGLGQKIFGTASDSKDSIVSAKDKSTKKAKETASDVKEAAKDIKEKTSDAHDDLSHKIIDKASDTKHKNAEKLKETASDVKEVTIEAKDKAGSLITDVGQEITSKITDTKDNFVYAKDKSAEKLTDAAVDIKEATKDTKDKTSDFVSDLGQKITETTSDAKESLVSAKDKSAEKLTDAAVDIKEVAKDTKQKTGGFFSNLGKKFTGSASDAKEGLLSVKDKTGEKITDVAIDVKEAAKDTKDKTSDVISDLGSKITETTSDAKESLVSAKDKSAEKLTDAAADIKEVAKYTKDKTGGFFSNLGQNITETTSDAKESLVSVKDKTGEKITDAAIDIKEAAKDTKDKTSDFISDIGQKLTEKTSDAKESLVSAKDKSAEKLTDAAIDIKEVAKDTKEKTGGFFSNLGQKITGTASDAKESIVSVKDNTGEKITDAAIDVKDAAKDTKDKTSDFISDIGQKVTEKTSDAKENLVSAKDKSAEKLTDVAIDIKEVAKDTKDKTGGFFSNLGQKITGTASDAKESLVSVKDKTGEKITDAAIDVKEAAKDTKDKTSDFISDIGQKVTEQTSDAKESLVSAKDKSAEKLTGAAIDIKEVAKDTKDKTGGFFSNLGQKITGTASDAKESLVSVKDKTGEKITDAAIDVKEAAKDTKDKTSDFISDIGQKVTEKNSDAKESLVSAKDKSAEKLTDAAADTKEVVKDTKDKTGGFFSNLGQKITGTASDANESLVSVKDKTGEKITDAAIDVKEAAKDTKDKTSDFISDIGQKVTEKTSDAKESLVSAKDKSAEKLTGAAIDIKEVAKDTKDKTGGFFSNLGQKITGTASDAKESLVSVKDKTGEKITDAAIDVKEAAKDTKDKTSDFISDIGQKVTEKTSDAKESLVSAKDKSAEKLTGAAIDIKEVAKDTKDKTGGFFSNLGQKITGTASDAKESLVSVKDKTGEKITDAAIDVKEAAKDTKDKTSDFISDLGSKITETTSDAKESLVSAKDTSAAKLTDAAVDIKEVAKDTKDKTGGFISNLGQKITGTASDAKESLVSVKDKTGEKITDAAIDVKEAAKDTKDKTSDFFSGIGQKITETTSDTKESLVSAKDKSSEKVTDAAIVIKETAKDATDKTSGFFSNLGQKITGTASDAKESLVSAKDKSAEKVIDAAIDIKETAKETKDKTSGFFGDLGQKITGTANDAKESLVSAKDKSAEKVTDAAIDIKETAKDATDKTSGFFSDLGQKISGTASDTKESLVSVKDKSAEKVTDAAIDIKETAKETKDKTSGFFGDLGQKITGTASDAKESLVSAKDKSAEKVTDVAIDIKETVKETKDKTSGFFSDLGQMITGTASDATESLVSAKDKSAEKVTHAAIDIKETAKDATDKTSGFFSDLGQKITGTASDAKESLVSAKDKSAEKVTDAAVDIKETAKETKDKTSGFFSDLGQKITGTASDAKESLVSVKDKSSEKVTDAVIDIRETAKDTKDKTGGFFGDLGDKLSGTASGMKQSLESTKDKSAEKGKDTVSDAKKTVKDTKDKTSGFFSDLGDKISDTASDTKHSLESAKDKSAGKIKETFSDVKEAAKDKKDETGGFFSDLGDKISDTASDTKHSLESAKDKSAGKIKETFSDVKEAAKDTKDKTGGFFSDLGDNISDTTSDTKHSLESAKDKSAGKIKETVSDVKEAAKDTKDKTGGFFSDLGDKISDTASDTKHCLESAKDKSAGKIKETFSDVKEATEDTKHKTGGFFSDLGDKISDTASDTKHSLESAKDKSAGKIKETFSDVKEAAKDTKDKTGGFFSDLGDKISDTASDTKHSLESAKDKSAGKIKETFSDVKGAAKDTKDKTGGFFSDLGDKISDTTSDTKHSLESSKDKSAGKIKETFSDVKEAAKDTKDKTGGFFSDLGDKISDTASDTKHSLESAKDKSAGKIKETFSDAKGAAKDTKDKTGGFFSDLGDKISDTAIDTKHSLESAKDKSAEKFKGTVSDVKGAAKDTKDKTGEFFSDLGDKISDTASDTKHSLESAKDKSAEKFKGTVSDVKGAAKDTNDKTGEFFGNLGHKISDTASDTKHSLKSTKDKTAENFKETVSDVKDAAKDTKDKTSGFLSGLGQKISSAASDTKDNLVSAKDKSAEKVKETVSDVKNLAKDTKDETNDFFTDLGQKISDTKKDKRQEKVKQSAEEEEENNFKEITSDFLDKTNGFDNYMSQSTTDIGSSPDYKTKKQKSKMKETKRKISEQNIDLSNLPIMSDLTPKKAATKTKSDSVCYVTTPSMQRRGIGGSQRLNKDERPSLIDISHMPADSSSSDEDEYIVTEPADDFGVRSKKFKSPDAVKKDFGSENAFKEESFKVPTTIISPDHKRRPLFHIASEDDDSFDRGVSKDGSEDIVNKIVTDTSKINKSFPGDTKSDTKSDTQYDVDLIEQKLSDINKALDSLEKADIELNNTADLTDDKTEHKLKRVERRFERMASETIEKENEVKKKQDITSPEIEATREAEFQKIVSQLSREEVSDSQNVYSNLWDEITFTPSEEWDSKTPDSPPDDIQELPQGEIVYMGPVTLNKDNLVNKAGIEIDIIPIKRSPCSSPQPRRPVKKPTKIRARSEMGFYAEKEIEDTGSLPDLERIDKKFPKLDIKKGKIMSAVIKFNDEMMSRSYEIDSTSSSVYNSLQNISPFLRRQSDSVAKGSLVNVVKDWMAKSSPFGSTENVKSVDTNSLADTNISIFDDDDIDSIEMSYSDCGAYQTDNDIKSENLLPDIHVYDDENLPILFLYDDNDSNNKDENIGYFKNNIQMKKEQYKGFNEETSCGPLTNLTSEGSAHLTTNKDTDYLQTVPKPKPRIVKTPTDSQELPTEKTDILHTETSQEDDEPTSLEIDSYSDRKKFWENMTTTSKTETSVKKRMSLFEEQIYKTPMPETLISKRASIHDLPSIPPVPKPRSTVATISVEEQKSIEEESLIEKAVPKDASPDQPRKLVSEYMASYRPPSQPKDMEPCSTLPLAPTEITKKPEKSESVDSEAEYISKYGVLEAYENVGYQSDSQEDMFDTDAEIIDHSIPPIKKRQMSVCHPPVAAARKTIFERSLSLPGEDLQDVSEQSVKARKRFFEQQIKNEMVIDQLMTQLDEEPIPEVKTLASDVVQEHQKAISSAPELGSKDTEQTIKTPTKTEPKFSPSSSSSQDTRTEEDITQDTPSSVKDVTKSFQVPIITEKVYFDHEVEEIHESMVETSHAAESEQFESSLTESSEDIKKEAYELDLNKDLDMKDETECKSEIKSTTESVEQEPCAKQFSIESDISISSERSLELGSLGDVPSQLADGFHYKSDSMSKPSDSLEVHVDKSETEDSEKITDIDQDFTSKSHSFEMRSYGSMEHTPDIVLIESKPSFDDQDMTKIFDKEKQLSSPINQPKEQIPDTVWEVIQSQPISEIVESVTEIPIERQVIVEREDEFSESVRDESDLASEIHQDHSETSEPDHIKSESHSEVEKLILESLYHQKIHPDEARKIAAELIDDIETEIERRNLIGTSDSLEAEPPVPPPDVAKNQISEYLRQLAECKGLDEREVQLVESVLARKHSELSRLSRRDTQTSSMEITDEDLKYSGAECDLSPYESQENILEEQAEHEESEKSDGHEKSEKIHSDKEQHTEKRREEITKDTHTEKEEEKFEGDTTIKYKSELEDKLQIHEDKMTTTSTEQLKEDDKQIIGITEEKIDKIKKTEEVVAYETMQIKSDDTLFQTAASTKVTDDEQQENISKLQTTEILTDSTKLQKTDFDESQKTNVALGGIYDSETAKIEAIEGGFKDTKSAEKVEINKKLEEERLQKVQQLEEITTTDDGTQITTSEVREEMHTKTQSISHVVGHKFEETITTTEKIIEYDEPEKLTTIEKIIEYDTEPLSEKITVETVTEYQVDEPLSKKDDFVDGGAIEQKIVLESIIIPISPHDKLKQTFSDDSKSSLDESVRSPEEKSSSSSARKDDSENIRQIERPDVIFRKTKIRREFDSSSSSGNLRADRKSGADFETYSSSGESHYHSFEDSAKSRPCSSDVEGLLAAGSSEYESALTSQDMSSRSHLTSAEYHTAHSSLSSRESMKSLDTESSGGNMASVEVSEASETLVPSTFELDGDILDGSQLLEDEVADVRFDQEPSDFLMCKTKTSFETTSDSDLQGESIDISEEDQEKPMADDPTYRMKRSQEMTFQPEPKVIIADSPQSENAIEMDERFGSSLEDGSVLSMSLSSASDMAAIRTVIELSRRDSDKVDASITVSGTSGQISLEDSENLPHSNQESLTASNTSLDQKTSVDMSTSTTLAHDGSVGSVTITTSTVEENGTQSVSTQVTSKAATSAEDEKSTRQQFNGPTQLEYSPEYDDVVEPKKVRGHRRNESTSFTPSMISGFTRSDLVKHDLVESDKYNEMSLKEVQHDEMKDVDETEKDEQYETEADQGYHKQQREAQLIEEESDQEADIDLPDVNDLDLGRPISAFSDSEDQRPMSVVFSEDRPESELLELMQQSSIDALNEPIERPLSPEPCEEYEIKEDDNQETEELYRQLQIHTDAHGREIFDGIEDIREILSDAKTTDEIREPTRHSGILSEKSSFEEAEAEAAFSMVAHISPAHKAKPICPILEDEDAEKHELETRERAQKDMEIRRAQILKDASPGSIPDITVTQHMTPLIDRGFHYPDLELEEKEEEELQRSTPQTPASNSSKSSEETDQGREYVLEETSSAIIEEPELEDAEIIADKKQMSEFQTETTITKSETTETKREITEIKSKVTETKSEVIPSTTEKRIIQETETKPAEPASTTESPNSDSFELLEQPDIIDDFVVIEEVAKEAAETDTEGKGVHITEKKYIRKHDEEVEEYLVRSAPTPLTRMTDLKYYPDGTTSDEVGPFDFEDSPPQAGKKEGGKTEEYDRELEASKKWIEMQFQGDQASMMAAGYGYEMEFERGPLEDIKEEEATDFDPSSSRIGSLESQKHSGGSLGSVKDSFSSTPEYDVLAGRKFFTRSGEHDDVSMSSLQEFENLERAISLENRRYLAGSQDSSSNGSFTKRYHTSRGQGDDISLSSLKEFEGLESACIAAHTIEVKAQEEEALLAQIDEGQENVLSEMSESCKLSSDSKATQEKEDDDYDKRMFEIDEIIRQAQSNVEKFIDLGDKEESIGRGDSLEEVAKVPDLDLDEPLVKPTKVSWSKDDPMQTSVDSLADQKPTHHDSTDSLDMKKQEVDLMTASTDSIEFQAQSRSGKTTDIMTDSIEIHDQDSKSCMINSDSLELTQGTHGNLTALSDSIDEDGSRIGDPMGQDQSSSSGRGEDYSSSGKDDIVDQAYIQNQCAEFLIGSTDSLDPTSSTATHATYQYETDSVMSGSFTSGGSNTMVSSTDTIDPLASKACGVDLAAAVRKVWFDDDAFEGGKHFTTELIDDGSKPFVTEVIEPCEDDPDYSHTIHRRVEMPPEIKKITFRGPDADQQLRQYVENFGEGEDIQETEETDKDGNVHVKRVIQKRFIVKSEGDGSEKRLSGPELESYLQQVSMMQGDFDLKYRDPTDFGQKTDSSKSYQEDSSYRQQSSSSDATSEQQTLTRHVEFQQEPSGSWQETTATTRPVTGTTATPATRAEEKEDGGPKSTDSQDPTQQRYVPDQQQLSSEMKELLEEMEKQAKQ